MTRSTHSFRKLLLTSLAALLVVVCAAQQGPDARTRPAHAPITAERTRANQLVEHSIQALEGGRIKEAIELATMGSAEVEKHGTAVELAHALMQLARAHKAGKSLDNAIGATLRVTLVHNIHHSPLRTEALLQLADLYLNAGHPSKALEHLSAAALSTGAAHMDKSRHTRLEARAKTLVTEPEALVPQLEAYIQQALDRKDLELQLDLYAMLASSYANLGRHANALATEEEVLRLAVLLDRPAEAAVCTNNMGALYHRMGRMPEALTAYAKGLIMVEDLPYIRLGMQLNSALAHSRNGSHTTAQWLSEEAMTSIRKGTSPENKPYALRTLAAIHLGKGDLRAAQNFALDALSAAQTTGDLREQVAACDMLAGIFDRLGLQQEVKTHERRSRELEQEYLQQLEQASTLREEQLLRLQRIEREQVDLLNREQRKETKLRQLALDAENQENQFALLTYEKQLQEAARREAVLAREQMDRELRLTQVALDAERKDRMLKELDNEHMLQSLAVAKMESERKEHQRTMELLEQRNEVIEVRARILEADKLRELTMRRFFITLACIAVLVTAWMAWAWVVGRRRSRTIADQNQRIQGINHELATKNQDIQSSINYARTIQAAILPDEEDLRRNIGDGFLLYKPLDIVSGDLPFVKQYGSRLFVAAIDCTGHGVPAAMMTFIAHFGLKELLIKHAHEPAGKILDRLHQHVGDTMRARSAEHLYSDGFDIGLCILDQETGAVSFAGAQLPLLLVRAGRVTRIRGDIFPLGDEHFQRSGYSTHQLDLERGDSLFMLSDGLIHQFGGPDGHRKFSMKRLMDLMERTADLELHEIKRCMADTLVEWQGDVAQTDDVLLIGMRYAA